MVVLRFSFLAITRAVSLGILLQNRVLAWCDCCFIMIHNVRQKCMGKNKQNTQGVPFNIFFLAITDLILRK
jgi:hypothetical protein